jgi:hypothetical protein
MPTQAAGDSWQAVAALAAERFCYRDIDTQSVPVTQAQPSRLRLSFIGFILKFVAAVAAHL